MKRKDSSLVLYIGLIGAIAAMHFLSTSFNSALAGIISFLLVIIAAVCIQERINEHQDRICKHGVYNGRTIGEDGKLRCHSCQQEKDEQQKKWEEEKRIAEYKKQWKMQYEESIMKARENRQIGLSISENSIMNLTPYEFEEYIAEYLKKIGFEDVSKTPFINDGGKDIVCKYRNQIYYVECKHYKKNASIGRPMIQKLGGAMAANNISNGIFITTCRFTKEAVFEAESLHIQLVDGERLFNSIARHCSLDGNELRTYSVICPECGEPVEFEYFGSVYSKDCKNGHHVAGAFNQYDTNTRAKSHRGYHRYNDGYVRYDRDSDVPDDELIQQTQGD